MIEHRYLDSVAAYALGALSAKEREECELHLARGCDLCEPELFSLGDTAAKLPYALPTTKLPAGLKEKIRRNLPVEEIRRPASSFKAWLLPVAAVLLLTLLLPIIWKQQSAISQKEKELAELQKMVREQQGEIAWLRDPSVQLALLSGLQPAPGAKGKMIWNPNQSKGIFYANHLPSLQPDKSYQLWVIGKQGPVSAGVFEPSGEGSAVITITRIEGPAEGSLQFAVTIEPRGGVPQPTGSMILAGKPL